jgi:hypothetical protein
MYCGTRPFVCSSDQIADKMMFPGYTLKREQNPVSHIQS